MNKLQLYITMSQDGAYKTMVEINPDTYVKSWVTDLRQAVSQVAYPPMEKAIFYMVKYIDSGVFIVVLRTIPKTPGNHLAAWIFIPYSLRIPNKDVVQTVDFITQKVSNPEMKGKDLSEINEVLERRYEEDLQAPVFPPSQGITYAYRYYGPRVSLTLADLIGPYLYQTPYLPFSGVLIVDHDITNDIAGTNLTSAPLDDMAVLLPPESPSEDGYTATIYGEPFDFPYYVPMTRNIDIIWRKDDATDVKQTLYVVQSEMRAPNLKLQRHTNPYVNPSVSSISSTPSAQSASQSTVPDASAAVTSTPPISNTESDVPQRKKTYHFQIPAKSAAIGTVIEFEITTNSDLDESPIDGYVPSEDIQEGAGRSNHLLFKGGNAKQRYFINAMYAIGGCALGVLITLLCTCGREKTEPMPEATSSDQIEVVEATVEAVPAEPTTSTTAPSSTQSQAQTSNASTPQPNQPAAFAPNDYSLAGAIKYLDTNTTWDRAEMEKYPDLKGLYADLNNIERHKIVEVWGPKLKESRAFSNQIVHHSRLSYKKTPRKKPYNDPGQPQTIRIQNYLNNIDP